MPMKTRQLKIYEMQQKKSKEFIAIKSYLKKQERHWMDNLTLHLKQLEKEKEKIPKISRRKEIIKTWAEINEREMKETIVKLIKLKAGSLRR